VESLRRLKQFLIDTWAELKKTTWPSRVEVYGTTLVVIVTVLICSFYLWVVDLFLAQGIKTLMGAFGQ
jgi:preprotein translocase subunit SecE